VSGEARYIIAERRVFRLSPRALVAVSEILRSFRRNAVHVRQALTLLHDSSGRLEVERGYLQNAGVIERYKRLSIPVRRALNAGDRASVAQALDAVSEPSRRADDRFKTVAVEWRRLQGELDTEVGLGGGKVPRRDIVAAWLNAAAFYDKLERDHAYDRLIEQWGPAAESIGVQLTEEAAKLVLLLDEAVAGALEEPVILPPPQRTPPPPPDPEGRWWRRWFGKGNPGSS
jgi:hypothetical protein